jgi:hypothetical protein
VLSEGWTEEIEQNHKIFRISSKPADTRTDSLFVKNKALYGYINLLDQIRNYSKYGTDILSSHYLYRYVESST